MLIFLPNTLKVTGSTISTPKSYDEHPCQVKYGSSPPPQWKNEAIYCTSAPIPTGRWAVAEHEWLQGVQPVRFEVGYHQLELTLESRGITTFVTHQGSYRYKRLLFGVSSASEIYQHELWTSLAGIDDIIVHGPDQWTHEQRLHEDLRVDSERRE